MKLGKITFEKFIGKEIPKTSGVYVICIADQNEKGIPINRIGSKDEHGILSIGKSDEKKQGLKGRVKSFFSAIDKYGIRHSEGRTLHLFNKLYNFSKRIRIANFIVYCYECENAEENEKEALKAYVEKYLELPPLNHQFVDRDRLHEDSGCKCNLK